MNLFLPPVEFDPRAISDAALAEFRKLALQAIDEAPRFGAWLHRWCDTEQAGRMDKPRLTMPARHFIALPHDIGSYSNKELGQALEVTTYLSYHVSNVEVGAFIDRLVLVLAPLAAQRLAELP